MAEGTLTCIRATEGIVDTIGCMGQTTIRQSATAAPLAPTAALVQVLLDGQREGKVVAVGECGLDYDRLKFCKKETQQKWFARQFELARDSQLPMFLHSRAAADDFGRILRENLASFSGACALHVVAAVLVWSCCRSEVWVGVCCRGCGRKSASCEDAKMVGGCAGGVVHSFTGTVDEVEDLLGLDPRIFIGINGCSLKTTDNLNAMALVPLTRMMLETDAPWCDCRPTHASAEHVTTKRQAVDKKKHSPDLLVKGRNEPCNMIQVRPPERSALLCVAVLAREEKWVRCAPFGLVHVMIWQWCRCWRQWRGIGG